MEPTDFLSSFVVFPCDLFRQKTVEELMEERPEVHRMCLWMYYPRREGELVTRLPTGVYFQLVKYFIRSLLVPLLLSLERQCQLLNNFAEGYNTQYLVFRHGSMRVADIVYLHIRCSG